MSGLVAPTYGVVFLWLLWGALLVATVHIGGRRPLLALAVPVVALGMWFLVLFLGDQLFGWTA